MTKVKVIFFIIISIIVFYVANKLAFCFVKFPLNSEIENAIYEELQVIKIHLGKVEITSGIIAVLGIFLIYLYNKGTRKNFLEEKEHGSAKWGTKKDIIKFKDKEDSKNILFTQTEEMSINTRKTLRNNNVIVIGGSR